MKGQDTSVAYEWISDSSHLSDFVAFALGHERYCVDTEFHREKTYVPQLALVQVEVGGRIVLIDPLAVDAGGLEPLFSGPGTCIFHAAQQDLDVFTQVLGIIPSRMVDTQICAGFIGYSQPSLASLMQSLVRVPLPKGDRLSDWLRRPLSSDQRSYAAADVAHLGRIADIITEDLAARGRLDWAMEACEELRTRPTGPVDPSDAWLRVKDVRTLRGRARWVAREVARWRELRAMDLDIPPRHVLSDIAVLGVAQKAPRGSEELLACRGVDGRHARGSQGGALLGAIADGVAAAESGELHFPTPEGEEIDKALRPAVTLVSAWVTELARQSEIDASLLGTRRDIVDLLAGDPGARMARGWRADIVGRDIADLVEGRKALTFRPLEGQRALRLVDVGAP
jgi:ribonuclease D